MTGTMSHERKDLILVKKKTVVAGVVFIFVLVWLHVFMPTGILTDPLMTPEKYLDERPFIELFGSIIVIVPSSSVIVFALGIQIILLGMLLIKDKQKSWGLSLLFWGIGTILAGTSYQTLGYELKCSGQTHCLFTSWFELAYLFTTAISISLMAQAFANRFSRDKTKTYLNGYGRIALIVYTLILLLGALFENRIMISYELFTVFFMPLFVVFFVINILNYRHDKNKLDHAFIVLWLLFLGVNVAYYVYYFLGITSALYAEIGLWFSANDVLHVGLILWFAYFQFKIRKELNRHS